MLDAVAGETVVGAVVGPVATLGSVIPVPIAEAPRFAPNRVLVAPSFFLSPPAKVDAEVGVGVVPVNNPPNGALVRPPPNF